MWPDADHPADPYPGAVLAVSYVHVAEVAHGVRGGAVDGVPLDAWLRARGAAPLAGRLPVLAYGSNRNPSKISWLRRELGLGADPVVVMRASTTGVAAVWAAGVRARDGARPAVLAAAPGVVEDHAVWLATPEQVSVLDRCEGRDERFRLARLRTGLVTVAADGPAAVGEVVIDRPWVYVGHAALRRPLLVEGAPVRCADVPQSVARTMVGEPAPSDGLARGHGRRRAAPRRVARSGLRLRPAAAGAGVVAPRSRRTRQAPRWPPRSWAGCSTPAAATQAGFPMPPAGRPASSSPSGTRPRCSPHSTPTRARSTNGCGRSRAGTVCWAYAWRGDRAGLVTLPDGWVARAVS